MPRCISRAVLAAALMAAAAAVPATASAATCSPQLADGTGFAWDLDSDGSIDDGTSDAFDGYGDLEVSDGDSTESYSSDDGSCGREDGGREVTFPEVPAFGDLTFSRKVYVSPDAGFARHLDTVTNTGEAAVTVQVRFDGNLGSDGDTRVVASSSGDTEHTEADAWLVTDDAYVSGPDDEPDPEDPTVGHVLDSTQPVAHRYDGTSDFVGAEDDSLTLHYDDVTIPAGGSVTFMHVTLQRPVGAGAAAAADAARYARGAMAVYAGMTDAEGAALANFPTAANGDEEGDGVVNGSDNCLAEANPDQADRDGDARGDVCDPDDDGDGLSDAAEAEFGTDPGKADSDGDGRADKVDACPLAAGTRADGCPVEIREVPGPTVTETKVVTQTQIVAGEVAGASAAGGRPAPTSVSSKVRRSGRTYRTTGVMVPPAGVSAAQGCQGGELAVRVKAGAQTISLRRATLRSDCTYVSTVRFGLPERYAGHDRLTFDVRFLGNEELRPRSARRTTASAPS